MCNLWPETFWGPKLIHDSCHLSLQPTRYTLFAPNYLVVLLLYDLLAVATILSTPMLLPGNGQLI
jgi:hypothetical protein